MNKTRKNTKKMNHKKLCLKSLESKKVKNEMKNLGMSINVGKLKKNKSFIKEFTDMCVKLLNVKQLEKVINK